jgi:hypothetical protein
MQQLLKEAMKITGHRSKRTVIETALRVLIQIKKQTGIWQLKGKIHFDAEHPTRLARLGGQEPSLKGIAGVVQLHNYARLWLLCAAVWPPAGVGEGWAERTQKSLNATISLGWQNDFVRGRNSNRR